MKTSDPAIISKNKAYSPDITQERRLFIPRYLNLSDIFVDDVVIPHDGKNIEGWIITIARDISLLTMY